MATLLADCEGELGGELEEDGGGAGSEEEDGEFFFLGGELCAVSIVMLSFFAGDIGAASFCS